jgi:hypothetical protein
MSESTTTDAPVSTWKITGVAICMLVLFGCSTVLSAVGPFIHLADKPLMTVGEAVFATVIDLGFVIGAVGLLRLRRWALWLTIVLCGISIVQVIWSIAKLTSEKATKSTEIIAYIVAGFYLAIAFFLTSASTRKAFANPATSQPDVKAAM